MPSVEKPNKQLRILLVLQFPWGAGLGVCKVHYDLKLQYEKLGHKVDVLSYSDIYKRQPSKLSLLFRPSITLSILKQLKQIAHKYDVIDANYGCLPYPKERFGFSGVVLFRSHGLPQVYRAMENSPPYKTMLQMKPPKPQGLKTKIGNIRRYVLSKKLDSELENSIRYADIVHCLNSTEKKHLTKMGIPEDKIALIFNGISDEYIYNASKIQKQEHQSGICFLASWTDRKGIYDLPNILTNFSESTSKASLNLIGTQVANSEIFLLDKFSEKKIINIPQFNHNELASLLRGLRVGLFPSYIEGFGLAVVEQLAAGIPVVAYDVPGPREILSSIDENLLVNPGDTKQFAKTVSSIYDMKFKDYSKLSDACKNRANEFKASKIASIFLNLYKANLFKHRQTQNH